MAFSFEFLILITAILWILVLTLFFWRMHTHYNNLTQGVTSKGLRPILEQVIKMVDLTQKDVEILKKRCDTIEKDGYSHIQKVGLLRFNPFKDTGGDQSFVLSLVDGNETGIVVSGLYSRSGTRWYAKRVVKGKGIDHDLSEEESKAIKEAQSVGKHG